jgi:hypothetical protein
MNMFFWPITRHETRRTVLLAPVFARRHSAIVLNAGQTEENQRLRPHKFLKKTLFSSSSISLNTDIRRGIVSACVPGAFSDIPTGISSGLGIGLKSREAGQEMIGIPEL